MISTLILTTYSKTLHYFTCKALKAEINQEEKPKICNIKTRTAKI